MHIIIFAGGTGTRLWPLSRRNSPKQFEKIKDGKSTLQLCLERIHPLGLENVYISTNEQYVNHVREQAPELPVDHIFSEPAKRDLAAAVGLTLMRLKKRGFQGPVALLWSDHFMDRPAEFVAVLKKAEQMVLENPNHFVFLGEKPRFANHNLGWIHVGEKLDSDSYRYLGWRYRPDKKDCDAMFASGDWLWNPGYFIFDLDFVLNLYQKLQPEMYKALYEMAGDEELVRAEYPKLPVLHFDTAIVEKIDPALAVVLAVDLGWSDPGTLYALKEALVRSEEDNCLTGNVIDTDSKDCLVHNEEEHKLVATVGLRGIVIVNTKDALLVCHKDAVPDIKALLYKIEDEGKERYL